MESGEPVRQGRAQPPPREHRRRRPPALRLDHRARGQDAEAAHHLRRAQRRRVQELAVGREPQADVGDVRAAARARQPARASSTSATTTSRELFDESHLEVLTVFAAQASLLVAQRAAASTSCKLDNRSLHERHRADPLRRDPRRVAARCRRSSARSQKVATTDISVLITGETGTGKELIARELHSRSPRAKRAVHHHQLRRDPGEPARVRAVRPRAAARSPARSPTRPGRFQAADGGTLFLDEIGEMPLDAAGEAPARAAGEGGRPRRRHRRRVGRHPRRRGDEPRPRGRDQGRPLPRGPLLPAQRRQPAPAAAARPRRRHRRARALPARRATRREYGSTVRGLHAERASPRSSATAGRATSASSRTASRRRSCWPTSALLGPEDLDLPPDDAAADPAARRGARRSSSATTSTRSSTLNNGNRTKTARDLGVDPRTIFRHLEKGENGDDIVVPAGGGHDSDA